MLLYKDSICVLSVRCPEQWIYKVGIGNISSFIYEFGMARLVYQDNLLKYGNFMLKFAGRYFYLLVTIFSKKKAILVQKLWG